MEGTIKWYNSEKGFGFIKGEKEEYFVHASELKSQVEEGDEVTFDAEENDRGHIAKNVRK